MDRPVGTDVHFSQKKGPPPLGKCIVLCRRSDLVFVAAAEKNEDGPCQKVGVGGALFSFAGIGKGADRGCTLAKNDQISQTRQELLLGAKVRLSATRYHMQIK